ncbi:MAG TPA: acyl-CoA dehydrogenase family protein [Candidatus Dormibacteraeota bacterium]|nr:acyl-CoA dehydrogenase family protein [Candidatus Dormibacteraeota bacterium]
MKTVVDSGITDLSQMNFDVSDEQKLILDEVDRACRELRPFEDEAYLAGRFNEHIAPVFKKAQLLGLPISRSYGEGQGADVLTYALALERVGREGTGVRTFLSGHVSLGQVTIQKWANEDQKEKYLPPATRGEKIMCFGLTEPTAGSDPSSLRTTFEDKGNFYVLNGSKAWISNGSIADVAVVFAYPKGKKEGMCAFIVEKGFEGYSSQQQKHKLGMPTSDTGSIFLDNCRVPKENLMGQPGKGLGIAYSGLMSGRLSVAAGCLGVIEDCIDEAVSYSRQRIQHGKPIGKHQLVQRHIGDMSTSLEAAKGLVYKAALLKQRSDSEPVNKELREYADIMIAKAKYFASKASFDAADRTVQIFGSSGYSFETRAPRHLVDTRVCRIYEGTDEIMVQKIAVSLLGSDFEAYR